MSRIALRLVDEVPRTELIADVDVVEQRDPLDGRLNVTVGRTILQVRIAPECHITPLDELFPIVHISLLLSLLFLIHLIRYFVTLIHLLAKVPSLAWAY